MKMLNGTVRRPDIFVDWQNLPLTSVVCEKRPETHVNQKHLWGAARQFELLQRRHHFCDTIILLRFRNCFRNEADVCTRAALFKERVELVQQSFCGLGRSFSCAVLDDRLYGIRCRVFDVLPYVAFGSFCGTVHGASSFVGSRFFGAIQCGLGSIFQLC